jgi:hypothetical protein
VKIIIVEQIKVILYWSIINLSSKHMSYNNSLLFFYNFYKFYICRLLICKLVSENNSLPFFYNSVKITFKSMGGDPIKRKVYFKFLDKFKLIYSIAMFTLHTVKEFKIKLHFIYDIEITHQ